MASNTRSKSTLKNIKAQNRPTISEEDVVMNTYSSPPINNNDTPQKRAKMSETSFIDSSPMDLDGSSSPLHPLSSEPDVPSRDDVPTTSTTEPMEIEQPIISNKGKATAIVDTNNTSAPKDQQNSNLTQQELHIEDFHYDEIEEHNHSNSIFSLFTTRASFPSALSYLDIRLKIREAFSIHSGDLTQIFTTTVENIEFIIIQFSSQSIFDKYVNQTHDILKVVFQEYNSTNIQNTVLSTAANKEAHTIKLIDVPIQYETAAILKVIINVTGKEIVNHYSNERGLRNKFDREMTHFKREKQKNSRANIFAPRPPQFKNIYIEFRNSAGPKYLLEKGWALPIENFVIQILPSTNHHQKTLRRTSHGYKITGLPSNTVAHDLKKIIALLHGETCTIHNPRNVNGTKTAIVMVHKDNFSDKVRRLKAFNTTLYIIPTSYKGRLCMQYGSPSHLFKECDAKKSIDRYNRQTFDKILINRSRPEIKLDESIGKNYGQLLKINASRHSNQRQQQRVLTSSRTQHPNALYRAHNSQQGSYSPDSSNFHHNINPSKHIQRSPTTTHSPPTEHVSNSLSSSKSNSLASAEIIEGQAKRIAQLELLTTKLTDRIALAKNTIKTLIATAKEHKDQFNAINVQLTKINNHNTTSDAHIGKILSNQETAFAREDKRDHQLSQLIATLSSSTPNGPHLLQTPHFPDPYQHVMPTNPNFSNPNWDKGEHYTPNSFNNNSAYYPQSDCGFQSVPDNELTLPPSSGSDDTITNNNFDNVYDDESHFDESSTSYSNQNTSTSLSGLASKLNPFGRR